MKKKIVLNMLPLFLHLERLIRYKNYREESIKKFDDELKDIKDKISGKDQNKGWLHQFKEKENDVWNFINGISIMNGKVFLPTLTDGEILDEKHREKIKDILGNLKEWAA